ncbi:hypothetical protein [Maioricimonas rarisocia]|uniref:hypothetical protein n=1 Tax=Maioricimonas rarisocia TaxID=2528026 RepID=UPI0018D23249|nr:hypothetical protein [Maioricimonas rarisocia]
MNYFAHGLPYLDQPYVLAGTAVPDWLSVVDRRARVRARTVAPHADATGAEDAQLAAGILQHLDDDQWFHGTRGFVEVTGAMTREFREVLGPGDGMRCSFLGHIVTELLLDRVLIEQHPGVLDRYYEVMSEVEPTVVEANVNRWARQPTRQLDPFIPLFLAERFLDDYRHTERLLRRLNQVMRRVKLPSLPREVLPVLEHGAELVRDRQGDLLPAERYPGIG